MAVRKRRRKREERLGAKLLSGLVFLVIFVAYAGLAIALSVGLYEVHLISYNQYTFLAESLALLALSAAVLTYLRLYKRYDNSQVAETLGISLGNVNLKAFGVATLVFVILLAFELLTATASNITNTPINTNVDVLLAGAPLWFYFFVAVIEPINEEIFFRGFLVPRLWIVPAAILFAAGHLGYMSTAYVPGPLVQAISLIAALLLFAFAVRRTRSRSSGIATSVILWGIGIAVLELLFVTGNLGIEVAAALVFGLITGYVFKRTSNLYPSIVAHIAINSVAVIGLLYPTMFIHIAI